MKRILDVVRSVELAGETLLIRLILREQQFRVSIAIQPILAQFVVGCQDYTPRCLAHRWFSTIAPPRPGIAEPQRWDQSKPGRRRTTVVNAYPDEYVNRTLFGVLDEYVKIAVLLKHSRIHQFVLQLLPGPPPALLHQVVVGKLHLRLLVPILHLRELRRAHEVAVVLL